MSNGETVPKRAAIYCRISDDREGRGLGIARQERELREVCSAKGLEVVKVFSDNDISASRYSKKARPRYQALLEAIKGGQVDVVVVWDLDRLCRRPIEQEAFYDIADAANVLRLVTRGEDFNLRESLVLPRVKAAIAAEESRKLSSRIRSKHAELLEQGAPSGGARRFGLTKIKRAPDGHTYLEEEHEEAEAIREAARDIIAGTSVRAICRRWEAEGLRGTRGARLSPQVVNGIMTSEWVAGRRAGKPAQWPAILDEQTWRLVGALIRSRVTGRSYPRALLSGIATCELCGHVLLSRPKAGGKPAYICGSDLGGCGKIRIIAADFEQDVLERLFTRVDPKQLGAEQPADDGTAKAMAEMARLEGVKTQLAELAGTGELDLAEFRAAKATNDRAMQALRETLARSAEDEAMQRARAEAVDLRAKWDDLGIEDRRRVVQALAERIEVGPALRGRNFYVPERVKVTYR
jgi:DNA invertase Pin-like site-specific DNA recombinase